MKLRAIHEIAPVAPASRSAAISVAIRSATHLLPAQGPITAFVHHNTLHALEAFPFEQGVVDGAQIFDCHPYLSEDAYRAHLNSGRIRDVDLETALIDDLGDEADELLGFLGTRFHLRKSMLAFPLPTGPVAEIRWIMEETNALRRFRAETPVAVRERAIRETRHWAMRDLHSAASPPVGWERAWTHFRQYAARTQQPHAEKWSDATWEACTLHLLWNCCREGVIVSPPPTEVRRCALRPRDLLLDATGRDGDELVHGLLIRLAAAYIDQGFSPWSIDPEEGFFSRFVQIYALPWGPPDRWMRGLSAELARLRSADASALASIGESLELMGVSEQEMEPFIAQSLLALRGYAGMIWQLETRPDRAARALPPGALAEFLAVRLVLDRYAAAYVAREELGYEGPLAMLRPFLEQRSGDKSPASHVEQRAFQVFQLAQLLGWAPETLYRLSAQAWSTMLREIERFSRTERRRIYHAAFERGFRVQALDALRSGLRRKRFAAASQSAISRERPAFQMVTCIDDREESFRRHLEETFPACETFGAAGFFAVAMYYRGATEAYFSPLCPVVVKPTHYVVESAPYSRLESENRRTRRRRAIGAMAQRAHLESRTFAGGWLAALLGSFASLPLVLRILFPRTAARLRRLWGGIVHAPLATELNLERTMEPPGAENGHVGFTIAEMASAVERILRDIGLTENFSRLILFCGHGSSSLNNPHESAYHCGACAGARGGPNARAIARMANDPRVRALLLERRLKIPDDVHFIGCYHDTCNDSVAYFDLDRLPHGHRELFESVKQTVDEARRRNAHERCRRFASVDLSATPDAALRHVEARSEDLSQARPEYNHATNALCIVGRRALSRDLFLDRRAFLTSYDPRQDDGEQGVLTRILQAVIPVCAGISLEYYFSTVDNEGYGCGNKLPHNITSLLGVMTGAASDLRPGLSAQMVEIHEPLRLLFVVETSPAVMRKIMDGNPAIARLVRGNWVQLALIDAETSEIWVFKRGEFAPYAPESEAIPQAATSRDWYQGWRDHLGFAFIGASSQGAQQQCT